MRIGVAGPIDLKPLESRVGGQLPSCYSFPMITENVEELFLSGHEVSVFALSEDVRSHETFSTKDGKLTIHVLPQRSTRARTADAFRQERQTLRDAMNDSDVDVVHANWTYEFGWAAAKSCKPAVVTAHDYPLVMAWRIRSAFRTTRTLTSWSAVRRASIVTAVSPGVAEHIAQVYRVRDRPSVVANAVSRATFRRPNEVVQDSGPVTFISIANGFDNRKNTAAALHAFAIAQRSMRSAKLILLGRDHGFGEAAYSYARQNDLATNVQFRGHADHQTVLRTLGVNNAVLVHTSKWEACCMAIAEALAMGVPVIGGSASGSVPWQLKAGESGKLVDVTDAAALADSMIALLDEETRRRMAIAAWERGMELHTYEQWLVHYNAMYEALANADR